MHGSGKKNNLKPIENVQKSFKIGFSNPLVIQNSEASVYILDTCYFISVRSYRK